MLPTVEEIVADGPETDQERVYSEYLTRLEEDRLRTEKLFDFFISVLTTLTANAANSTLIFLCIDFGMHWFSASAFGFALGCVPAAFHINNAEVNIGSEFKVKKITSLILAGGSVVGAFSVSYSSGGEKRTLVDYTNTGIKKASREISNYEVRISPWQGINFWFSYHGLEAVGNSLLPAIAVAALCKFLFNRR
jgi:hypothetical protein